MDHKWSRESVKKKSQLRSIMEKDPSPTNKINYKKTKGFIDIYNA